MQKEGPEMHNPTKFIRRKKEQGLDLQFPFRYKRGTKAAKVSKSVPADLARLVPADLARSVPADLARSVPAVLLDRFEQTFARSVPTKILDRESRPVWNNVYRINHQNKFAPTAVFTRFGKIPVSAAKSIAAASTSAAKLVNTTGPKQSVNFSKSRSTFYKSHSPIRRSFYNAKTHSRRNSTERVNTAGSKAVSVVKGNRVTVVKTSAGHPQQALKNKEIVDSGCSRHMTRNKSYLADYQEINNGGFVAFGSSRGNQTDKNAGPQDTNGNACTQDNVDIEKEVSDQHYIVLTLWFYISSTFKSSDDKAAYDKPKDDTEDAFRKESKQGSMVQRGTAKAGSTNPVNTVSNLVNVASTLGTFSAGGPSSSHPDAFIPAHTLLHIDQDDFQIPDLEDIAKLQKADFKNMESSTIVSHIPTHRVHLDHPKDQILGDPKSTIQTRGMAKKSSEAHGLMEPKKVSQALDDESWVEALQEELMQCSLQKKDERGIVVRNKARLVAQGHIQEEGIDYDEFFSPVARIEAVRIFLAFASFMEFIVYQMNVKSAFLYGTIEEEVYVSQHLGFIDLQFLNTVYTVEKALYGLHQALRAWFQVTPKLSHLHAVKRIFRKYTTRGCQFLSKRLISWQCKKQTIVATSTTEAEYVTAANYSTFSSINLYMADSKFVDQHNMVTYLEKIEENAEFHQIVDFLSTCSINYALTQIHAIVIGKAVVISESLVRSNLLFNDEDEVNTSGSGEDRMEHPYDLIDFVSPTPHDSPLLGEEAQTTQSKVITRLKLRVRRLEKKRKVRTSQPMKRRLFKGRVKTSTDKSLGEDASKQGRNDDKIEELNLTDGVNSEVIVEDKGSREKGGSTVDQVSTARPKVSTASVHVNVSVATPSTPPTTTIIFYVEEPPRLTRSTTTLQPLPTIDPKDKDLAQRIYEKELVELDRAQKEKQKKKEATIAILTEESDEIQARIDADHELAVRMTHKEHEKYTIEERERLLAKYFERRKKQLAVERAEAIRNKPPTKTIITRFTPRTQDS
nr:hypothetical protein [Tanacetum cinerariifolium]